MSTDWLSVILKDNTFLLEITLQILSPQNIAKLAAIIRLGHCRIFDKSLGIFLENKETKLPNSYLSV